MNNPNDRLAADLARAVAENTRLRTVIEQSGIREGRLRAALREACEIASYSYKDSQDYDRISELARLCLAKGEP